MRLSLEVKNYLPPKRCISRASGNAARMAPVPAPAKVRERSGGEKAIGGARV